MAANTATDARPDLKPIIEQLCAIVGAEYRDTAQIEITPNVLTAVVYQRTDSGELRFDPLTGDAVSVRLSAKIRT